MERKTDIIKYLLKSEKSMATKHMQKFWKYRTKGFTLEEVWILHIMSLKIGISSHKVNFKRIVQSDFIISTDHNPNMNKCYDFAKQLSRKTVQASLQSSVLRCWSRRRYCCKHSLLFSKKNGLTKIFGSSFLYKN